MASTLEAIWKNLHNKQYEPVYFLCGEEPYYIDLIEEFINNNALEPHEKDFNFSMFYGKDADPIAVLNDAKQYPTFADKRLVIVREAQDLKVKDWELFEKYLEQPVKSTILVFAHKNKTLDKRTKIAKIIEKKSVYFESKKIGEDALPNWIKGYVKKKNFTIDDIAAKILAENIGNDLSRIANEMDKLSVMLSENAIITADIIEKYIGISKEYNITEFNSAIIKRDFTKAMKMVLYFEKNPKAGPIIAILAFMYNHFSKLFVLHHIKDVKQATAAIGWIPSDVSNGIKYYSIQKTQEILHLLCEYDAKAKGLYATGKNTNADLLKELVIKVIRN
ncbi:MAG TPA: DNA polymerase III subunit delta [Chitinophagales bacterium]|nr:DNA polymerase III subunit delta [Chitinophagales bacterium]HMW11547.1 DNA polymerase III subunit delta [Chitinophagales bacterium]HMX59235.1 DNA polymerase III subunit delta [Chitinophagales bacterium]HMY23500.1 DNA polymerase III subunit delta [Chitinophagales bacterium]HMZ32582.1 DNA polymerase III subunit delta [Chitinophagales bacterium]